jgi:hypothetical protein
MSDPKSETRKSPLTDEVKKARKQREVKPKTFGRLLGDTIDQLDALDAHRRNKLLSAVNMHYGPNDAGA